MVLRSQAIALVVVAATASCADDPPDVPDLLIGNVSVVSADDLTDSSRHDVVVDDGRIAAIMPAGEYRGPTAARSIDGSGKFLAPGLIDGHTHLDEVPGMTFEHEQAFPDVASAAREQIPRSFLYHGFTTVVDLNSRPAVIEAWNTRPVRPEAYFCGAAPVFDGYPMSWMPKPVRYQIMPYFLFDASRADQFPGSIDPADHSPSAVVERIEADGGICVKTHYERGFGGRGDLPVPAIELVETLVAEAHDHELPVLLHANSESAQSFGNRTGVDAFAHGMWTWNDRTQTELTPAIRDVVDASIAEGIAVQPTIQVLYGEQDLHDPDYLKDPRLREVLPASLLEWYATEEGLWWRDRMLRIPIVKELVDAGRWAELDEPPIRRVSAVIAYFASQGGQLLFGSDTPSDPTFANPPGLNGRIEMQRWIEAGIEPRQLFIAATRDNAIFYGLDDEIGTIERGKQADLLLLRESPLLDVGAYDTIEFVIVDGVPIARAELAAGGDD